MSLYLKYRPKNFNDFVGNKQTIESLKSVIYTSKTFYPHSYVFEGDYGTGKTTLARILANIIGGKIIELDAGSDRGVEAADTLKKKLKYRPREGNNIIYIIDEIQTASPKYIESLLKIIEEPPSYLYFIICTTNPEKINKGMLDRCIKYHLFNYTIRELTQILENICLQENKNINKKVLLDISKKSNGSARNAITLLEKIIDLDPSEIEKYIFQDAKRTEEIYSLANALYLVDKWKKIKETLNNIKADPEGIRQYIIKFCINKLLNNNNLDDEAMIILNHFLSFPLLRGINKNELIFICAECLRELEQHVFG